MARTIPLHNTVRIRVAFSAGEPPPRHARVALFDNAVHRVINPRCSHVATFHGVPAGPTVAIASVEGRVVGRRRIVVPTTGDLDITLRAHGGVADDGKACHGGFRIVDEHTGDPLCGRKYRVSSTTGILVTGETNRNGETQNIGTDQPLELHLELLDDDDDDDAHDLYPEDDGDDEGMADPDDGDGEYDDPDDNDDDMK